MGRRNHLRPPREEPYWAWDIYGDTVAQHHAQGLRVLVRVDYDQSRASADRHDFVALNEYLEYLRRLVARRAPCAKSTDCCTDYNTAEANGLDAQKAGSRRSGMPASQRYGRR
jgi:hypothetical protein